MRFRPCIDLAGGAVVQIVGGSVDANGNAETNFESPQSPAYFARRYCEANLHGGHVIALGPGSEAAAREALAAWPGGMQYGGGVDPGNAAAWLDAGASHVIVTSWLFPGGRLDRERLESITRAVGRQRLVIDLSCRRRGEDYFVVTDRWRRFTEIRIEAATLAGLAAHCSEFLIHGVDVEGRRQGIEHALIEILARDCPVPVTYAGGIRSFEDIEAIERIGAGRIDFTVGSALDLFGGDLGFDALAARYRMR